MLVRRKTLHPQKNKTKGKNCCNTSRWLSLWLACRSYFVTQTSAPAPDSGLRIHADPRRLSVPPGASPPCVKIKEIIIKCEVSCSSYMFLSKYVCTVPFSQEVADGGLVQSLLFVKKLGHRLCSPFQQVIFNQVMDTLKEGEGGKSDLYENIWKPGACRSETCI